MIGSTDMVGMESSWTTILPARPTSADSNYGQFVETAGWLRSDCNNMRVLIALAVCLGAVLLILYPVHVVVGFGIVHVLGLIVRACNRTL